MSRDFLRLVLADDSLLFREGLARLLTETGFGVVGQAADIDELVARVHAETPAVAIVDIRMPPTFTTEGLVAAARLRAGHPGIGVLVLSQYVETFPVMQLIRDGARGLGYLLKDRVSDLTEFAGAVRRIGRGGSVIDSPVVARFVEQPRLHSPLAILSGRGAQCAGADGRGSYQSGYLPAVVAQRQDGRKSRGASWPSSSCRQPPTTTAACWLS